MAAHRFGRLKLVVYLLCCILIVGASGVWARPAADPSPVYLVKDIRPGTSPSNPGGFRVMDNLLFFYAHLSDSPDAEPWVSDGTEAGTTQNMFGPDGSPISWPTHIGDMWFFVASDTSHGEELWGRSASGGTPFLIKDINIGSISSGPTNLVNANGRLFFVANDGTHGHELWTSDGTSDGTYLVKDINSGIADAFENYVSDFSVLKNYVLFGASDTNGKYRVWSSDGTEQGTILLNEEMASSNLLYQFTLTNAGQHAFFVTGETGNSFTRYWVSDGTRAGTIMLAAINHAVRSLVARDGVAYFFVHNDAGTYDLWKSDGTQPGTHFVCTLSAPSFLTHEAIVNDTLFFVAESSGTRKLWLSDGTAAGTHEMSGGTSINPRQLLNVNEVLVFCADDLNGSYGNLWRSDGTPEGSRQLTEPNTGNGPSCLFTTEMAVTDQNLFFQSNDVGHGTELWAIPVSKLKSATPPVSPTTTPSTATPMPAIYNHFLPLMQTR